VCQGFLAPESPWAPTNATTQDMNSTIGNSDFQHRHAVSYSGLLTYWPVTPILSKARETRDAQKLFTSLSPLHFWEWGLMTIHPIEAQAICVVLDELIESIDGHISANRLREQARLGDLKEGSVARYRVLERFAAHELGLRTARDELTIERARHAGRHA
jgi:hypothetical protein